MAEIQQIGETLKLDPMGYFINPCHISHIASPWVGAIEDVKAALLTHVGAKIHSIYVRGSVAKGMAVAGVSDLDMFAIVFDEQNDIDMSWSDEFFLAQSVKYPFIKGIETGLAPLSKVLGPEPVRALRFLLKTQSVCVWGNDLIPEIESFSPGAYLTDGIHDFEENVENIVAGISEVDDKERLDAICIWIMKQVIRTGFLLVAERERTFTRDLYPCYQLFCRHYPEYAAEMKFALQSAIGPQCARDELLCFLDEFGKQLMCMVRVAYPRQNLGAERTA